MYIFYLKYIVELLRAPLYNFFFLHNFFPWNLKKKVRTQTLTKNKNYRALTGKIQKVKKKKKKNRNVRVPFLVDFVFFPKGGPFGRRNSPAKFGRKIGRFFKNQSPSLPGSVGQADPSAWVAGLLLTLGFSP